MNEKIINWISVFVILIVISQLYNKEQITEQQWLLIIFIPLGVGILYRVYAWKYARSVVIERRRLLKELWKRDLNVPVALSKYEEEIVVLLGRIKMAIPFTIGIVVIVVSIAVYRNQITNFNDVLGNTLFRIGAPGLALGSIFLANRLHRVSKSIERELVPDSKRELSEELVVYPPDRLLHVEIDRYKVHDFILPNVALPFWRMKEAERWLEKCGFKRIGPRVWEANKEILRYLNDDEILAIRVTESLVPRSVRHPFPNHLSLREGEKALSTLHEKGQGGSKLWRKTKDSNQKPKVSNKKFPFMFTRFYRLFLVIALAWLWLGGGRQYETDTKVFWSGSLIGGFVLAMWLDSLRMMGFRHLRMVPLLGRIFFFSKRGAILSAMIVLPLLYFWSPLTINSSPFQLQMSIAIVLVIVLLWTQPVCLLLLAESSQKTGRVLEQISSHLLPLRVVAMIDQDRTGCSLGGFSWFTDNPRTESEHEWRELVDQLSELVPNIVLDARTDNPVIIYEAKEILTHPERVTKAIFIVEDDGSALALEPHKDIISLQEINTITESMLNSTLNKIKHQ